MRTSFAVLAFVVIGASSATAGGRVDRAAPEPKALTSWGGSGAT